MHRGISSLRIVIGLVALGLAGVVVAYSASAYSRAHRAERAAVALQWEITVARSYAVRSGRPMSLVVNEGARTVILRDGSSTWRTVSFADHWRTRLDRLDIDVDGDSLIFTARGLCTNCGRLQPTVLRIESAGRSAVVGVRRAGSAEIETAQLDPLH
jgi:hypothetical protein